MFNSYSAWIGRQVVLQIESGDSRVPLRGRVVNESNRAVRFRLDECWDVDIFKEMILRVEADNYGAFQPSGALGSETALAVNSTPLLNGDRCQALLWSQDFSWEFCWKVTIGTGLAGIALLVLTLLIDLSERGAHLPHFICGYLGLLFCAVALGCGAVEIFHSFRPRPHLFTKRSDRLVTFLAWLQEPIN